MEVFMIEFACDCAMKKHRAPIEKYEIPSGAIKKIPELLEKYNRIYVVAVLDRLAFLCYTDTRMLFCIF